MMNIRKGINSYYETLRWLTQNIVVIDKEGKVADLKLGFEKAIDLITARGKRGKKMMFIGNGASASIASHMAADFWKNSEIRATAFNDAALLTCISNDFGYNQVFEKPIKMFANSGDILVAISSSGKSENIIRGVRMARSKRCNVITLSGFHKDNPLRSLGDINFYVPSSSYGQVEVVHHSICHCMLDTVVSGLGKGRLK
jgi:D-sedoheptulose 7-phosphate isomerase